MADKSSATAHPMDSPQGKHTHDSLIVAAPPEPWYRRMWRTVKNPKVAPYVGIGLFLVIGIVVTVATLYPQQVTTRAVAHQATVSILPATLSLPPNGALQVWATTDGPLAFVNVEVTFDPTVVKLSSEAALTTSAWGRVIKQTTMAEANATGKLDLVVGLDPAHVQTPPNGTFQIATLQFGANTTNSNVTTTVAVASAPSQLVVIDTTVFTLTTIGSTITVNPLPTPTPTLTPMPTTIPPTSTPIPTPTSTLAPTPTTIPPTSTPIPTPTPTRTPTPTPYPTPTPTRTPTPTPYPTTIPSPTPPPPPPVTDVVTIQSAYMYRLWRIIPRLRVVATSTMAPTAQLSVTGFGSLKYSNSNHTYSANFWVFGTWPTYVTVTSSKGGSASALVGRH
jgi:outer membrane biosynthesis protein TonB